MPGNVGNAEVVREIHVAGDVGENTQRATDQHGRHDRQTVEAISKIYRITEANNKKVRHDDLKHAEGYRQILEIRNQQRGLHLVSRRNVQSNGGNEGRS